jgi:hypothetical protein
VAEEGGTDRRRTGGSVAAAGVCCGVVVAGGGLVGGVVWMILEGREIKKKRQMGPTNRGGQLQFRRLNFIGNPRNALLEGGF